MVQLVNQPVSVGLLIDEEHRLAVPRWIKWADWKYIVREVGMHHSERRGIKKVHVFTVNVGNLDMRLEIDGESLAAKLVAVSDGLAD